MAKQDDQLNKNMLRAKLMLDATGTINDPLQTSGAANTPEGELSLEELIVQATQARDEAYEKLTGLEKLRYIDGDETGNAEYDQLAKVLELLREQRKQITNSRTEEAGEGWTPWLKYLPNAISLVVPVIQNGKKLLNLGYYGAQLLRKTSQLSADNLPADKRKILDEEVTTIILNLIEDADIMEDFLPRDKNMDKPIIIRDLVINSVIPNITNCPNIFSGIEEDFVKQLATTSLNLLSTTLKVQELNQKVRAIFTKLRTPDDNSMPNIFINSAEILFDPKVKKIVENDLIKLLENPTSQTALTKIAANYLGEHRAIPGQLLENTLSLIVNNNTAILSNTQGLLNIYKAYMEYQESIVDFFPNSTRDGNLYVESRLKSSRTLKYAAILRSESPSNSLPEASLERNLMNLEIEQGQSSGGKEDIKKLQQPLMSSILDNSQKIINSLAPVLKSELPKYLVVNQGDILDFIKTVAVQEHLISQDSANLIVDVAPTAIPFINDFLPLIIKLAEACVQNQEELEVIVGYIQDMMNSSEPEQLKEVSNLLECLVKFKNQNPNIQKIVEQEIPTLLLRHAEHLGNIIERLLLDNEWGQILHPKGEKIITILSDILRDYTKDMAEILKLYNQQKYREMVVLHLVPLSVKLLMKKEVLSLLVVGIANYCHYLTDKYITSNIMSDKIKSKKVNKIIEDISPEHKEERMKVGDKYDLALAFKQNGEKSDSAIINLDNIFIHKKLENYKIINFIFNKSKFQNPSFKNSILENCSFKEATFIKPVSFVGAVLTNCSFEGTVFTTHVDFSATIIDEVTLSTLRPVVEEYNKNHPTFPIKLDKTPTTPVQTVPEGNEKMVARQTIESRKDLSKVDALKKEHQTKSSHASVPRRG
ncbi:pentapeptide repeat-containing protein [Candidatus Tisiphia endosymbiont of Nemotelus uliginosus]|uniref:pentapeptide repeat-containing protein n=1 Tax=Candidatus Tisiphia endosymbiont of Nemotelus uliginosus TaxID=3077926 RepID=UPI0039774443